MSRYDVEVEERLQKLEAAVAALESHSHDAPPVPATGTDATVDLIIKHLAKNENVSDITG